jgi:drug/metabolite transporter (DMT)-like permease
MGAGVKLVAPNQPNSVIVFFRNLLALAVFIPWLMRREGLQAVRTDVLPLHLVRTLTGLAAMYCFFFTIARMRLADAVLLNYTVPLFMPIIARIWLKEEFNRTTLVPILVGFAGVALIVRPSPGLIEPVALVGLAAGLLSASAQVTIRRLTRSEPVFRIVLYFSFFGTLAAAAPVPWLELTLTGREWMILGGVGLSAAVAQVFLTRGYSLAPVAAVGPFIYSSVLFAGFFDWLLWGNLPDRYSLIGAGLVVLGGIAAMRVRSGSRGAKE